MLMSSPSAYASYFCKKEVFTLARPLFCAGLYYEWPFFVKKKCTVEVTPASLQLSFQEYGIQHGRHLHLSLNECVFTRENNVSGIFQEIEADDGKAVAHMFLVVSHSSA